MIGGDLDYWTDFIRPNDEFVLTALFDVVGGVVISGWLLVIGGVVINWWGIGW